MLDFKVNYVSSVPLHQQLQFLIKKAASRGLIYSGSVFPSATELSKSLNLPSDLTRDAYKKLLEEGTLKHVKGEGYFIDVELK